MSISNRQSIVSPTKLSYEHLVLFPNDGKRHEIIAGRHYMNAAPSSYHQSLSARIFFQLFGAIEDKGRGRVFSAPIDVQFTDHDVVEPDLIVVLAENDIITESRIQGSPDLVVEILSPSTKKSDEGLKKQLYEQHSVAEYWIVDPDKKSIRQFLLNERGTYNSGVDCSEHIEFRGAACMVVDLTKVW
jgi:Uma2 family endonuclease